MNAQRHFGVWQPSAWVVSVFSMLLLEDDDIVAPRRFRAGKLNGESVIVRATAQINGPNQRPA
jgi:hypothetical protein